MSLSRTNLLIICYCYYHTQIMLKIVASHSSFLLLLLLFVCACTQVGGGSKCICYKCILFLLSNFIYSTIWALRTFGRNNTKLQTLMCKFLTNLQRSLIMRRLKAFKLLRILSIEPELLPVRGMGHFSQLWVHV